MSLKYYKAYDKRYKQVHGEGLSWSVDNPTKLVEEIIIKYNLELSRMLEIGCGEGRDAKHLLNKGYNVLATDVSEEAIKYCVKNDLKNACKYKVLDVLKETEKDDMYDFIYSVACIHMLVLDEDREKFYQYIYNHLNTGGCALILSMGDGKYESKSDITKAFDNVNRVHQSTNRKLNIATTSCRIVNFDTLLKEVEAASFEIVEYGLTSIENHFDKLMYILIRK